MGRLAAIVVLAVVLVTPAAAGPEDALLAVSASGVELLLLTPAGEAAGRIAATRQTVMVDASWSPDGTRIAFTSPPPGGTGREVYVVNEDGSHLHAVTADSNSDRYNTIPLWISPSEVVYHRVNSGALGTELRVVDVETDAVRRLTADADANFPLRLQPRGSLLLYTAANLRRALVDIRGGEQWTLPEGIGAAAAWSHDGTLLAYGNSSGLHVIRPDGTGHRTVVAGRIVTDVAWAPDDRRFALTITDPFPQLSGKFGTPALTEVYTVAIDGTGLRRLTGMEGDTPFSAGASATSPSWWPDGSRLFFRARRAGVDVNGRVENWAMNTDGTCEMLWAPQAPTWAAPQWRPGTAPAVGPADCWSAIVRMRQDKSEIGLRDRLPLTVSVRNDGTRPLRNLRLELTVTGGALQLPDGCDELDCPLGTVAPGDVATLRFEATSRAPGIVRLGAAASYDGGADVFPLDDRATAAANVFACDLVGSWGADRIDGTPRRDRICGRPGDDRIDAGAGNDYIDAGSGRDTVLAGRGRDTVRGGGGADIIVVRDRERDVVDCGTETDTVIADRRDITRGCERVLRR